MFSFSLSDARVLKARVPKGGEKTLKPKRLAKEKTYKMEGSKFGMDGIRIDGSRQFIDAVLSQLKGLLVWENVVARLGVNYTECCDRETREPNGDWVCYIRVHQRGHEGAIGQSVFGSKKIKANTVAIEKMLDRVGR
jgi:hypothetical protein